jgi:hypothetical protein
MSEAPLHKGGGAASKRRFAKSDDGVSSQRDVREKLLVN